MLQQIRAHPRRVHIRLVHLVDGNDDGNTSGFRVVDRFNGLRHDAVVSGHHQNGNVGGFRTTRPHGREGFMAWRVDEGDQTTICLHLIGADVLGNATGFSRHHIGFAQRIQQRGFAMVNVTHDGDHGWARLHQLRRVDCGIKTFNHI